MPPIQSLYAQTGQLSPETALFLLCVGAAGMLAGALLVEGRTVTTVVSIVRELFVSQPHKRTALS